MLGESIKHGLVAILLFTLAGCKTLPHQPATAIMENYSSQKIMFFGGENNSVYLGCYSCSQYAVDSVFNQYGSYGSQFQQNSIFNRYGNFGSLYSDYSPCNPYANKPPVIVDGEGNFYGTLTLNNYHVYRTNNSAILAWLAGVCF